MDLTNLTIASAHQLLAEKKLSAPELVSAYLKRIKELEPKLGAFLLLTEEQALQQAKEAQKYIDRKDVSSPLLGIPVGHKDIFCTRGVETTAASNILKGYIPPYSATVVKRLEEAGAVCVGKLNCDAFAHGSSTENSDFVKTRNPYDLARVPGGSSGGSSAAVAASEVLFSTGTDTGGSIRLPAAFTNTVGLKPTYGRVSRYGVIAMASSLDSPGPITKTVQDCAYVMSVIAGHDPHDATSSRRPVPDYVSFLGQSIKGWKVGVIKEFFSQGLNPDVEQVTRTAIVELQKLGAKIEEVSLPYLKYSLAVYYIITPSEISSNLARYDGIKYGFSVIKHQSADAGNLLDVYERSRGLGFGAEAKRRIMIGTYALSSGYYDAFYKQALKVKELIRRDYVSAFQNYDLLVGPVSPTPAFKLGEKADDPLSMYLSDIYMSPVNLAGIPAISVPCGFVAGLPVGLQIMGPHFGEEKILQAAYLYEQATQFYKISPKI